MSTFPISRSSRLLWLLCAGVSISLCRMALCTPLPAGTRVSNFVLPDLRNQPVSLRAFLGRPIVLTFWRSNWGGSRQSLSDLLNLATKYRNDRLMVLALNLDEAPRKVMQFMNTSGLDNLPVLLGAGAVGQEMGVARTTVTYVLDGEGVVRLAAEGYDGRLKDRIGREIDLLTGKLQPEYGWRLDLARVYTDAENDQDPGRAITQLSGILPPNPLKVFIDTSNAGGQSGELLRAVRAGANSWVEALPKGVVTLQSVDNKDDADVTINFASQTYDPADQYGEKTLCANIRTISDKSPRGRIVATIGMGHASTGQRHSAAGIAHLAGEIIGDALGLAPLEDDPGSLMYPEADNPPIRTTPSPDDLTLLGRFLGSVQYRLGGLYMKTGRYKDAENAYAAVLALYPDNTEVRKLRADARSKQGQ